MEGRLAVLARPCQADASRAHLTHKLSAAGRPVDPNFAVQIAHRTWMAVVLQVLGAVPQVSRGVSGWRLGVLAGAWEEAVFEFATAGGHLVASEVVQDVSEAVRMPPRTTDSLQGFGVSERQVAEKCLRFGHGVDQRKQWIRIALREAAMADVDLAVA